MQEKQENSPIKEYVLFYHTKIDKLEGKKIPRVTVCAKVKEENGTAYLQFGFSRCNTVDSFSRKTGRELSEKRATTNPSIHVGFKKNYAMSNFLSLAIMFANQVIHGTHFGWELLQIQNKKENKSTEEPKLMESQTPE